MSATIDDSFPSQSVTDAPACSHYISPNGSDANPGTSPSQPWVTFNHAIDKLQPGDTLCIMDGTYYQSLDIDISGSQGNPITFAALNDGEVIIDGEFTRLACRVLDSHDVIVEGVICQRSNGSVVSIINSERVIVRRVSAYDVKATDCNCHAFVTDKAQDVLLEDIIAGGRARTTLTIYNSRSITIRRAYARWKEEPTSNSMGVNNLMQIYGTSDSLAENNVGTLNGATSNNVLGWGVWNNYDNTDPIASNNTLLGNVAFDITFAGFFDSSCKWQTHNNRFIDNVSINNPFGMYQPGDDSQILTHYTNIGGEIGFNMEENSLTGNCEPANGLVLGNDITNSVFQGASIRPFYVYNTEIPKNLSHDYNLFWENNRNNFDINSHETSDIDPAFNIKKWGYGAYLFPDPDTPRINGGQDGTYLGADVRFRYVDGVLTEEPLWPWPMEGRVCNELGVSVTWEQSDQISESTDAPCGGGLWKTLDGVYESTAPTFDDVPFDHWAYDYIEALYQDGYVAGCSTDPLLYCPEDTLTRAESAVFVERGIHGAEALPDQPTQGVFADVPLNEWFAKWVTALWNDGYTAGCGTDPLIYCPLQDHTRAEGSVFFLRMMHGMDYVPTDPVGLFADVPLEAWYADWVEAAYNAGIIPACETEPDLRFCPEDPLDRAMAAYMMVQAKNLSTP
jgi:hypothetical protein